MGTEINNLTLFSIDKDSCIDLVNTIIEEEKKERCLELPSVSISIVFVGTTRMRKLNRIYRKKDSATDVLSFPFYEQDLLGEVFVCPQWIKKTYLPDKKETDFTKYLFQVIIHGVLHILGYCHHNDSTEKEMNARIKYYLQKIKLNN